MDTTFESPRVLGVCAGIGGLERGVKLVFPRSRLVGLCERDSYAAAVLVARMEEQALDPAPVFAGDLHEFPAADFAGRVDLVCGGIPCQPYSNAGKQRRSADERDLVDAFLTLVRGVGPRFVFVENVAAFVREGLGRLLGGLTALGFDAEWTTLRASDIGAPHRRDRCFVLARRVPNASGNTVREFQQRGEGVAQPPEYRNPGLGDLGAHPLAYSNSERRTGQWFGGVHDGEPRNDTYGCRAWPLPWPPGPADRSTWAGVLEHDPDLAPALGDVRRVADGLPEGLVARADRLRCLGNAVVADQAAEALRILLSRI